MHATPEPRVSVVMTTYNAEAHVAQAVASVAAQTMPDWELVVVDDGSTDATRDLVQAAAAQDARIRLLIVPRMGRIPALNHAVRNARAPYIANLDADDVSYPDRLQREADYLDNHPDVGLVGAAIVDRIDDDGRPLPPVTRPTDEDEIRRLLGRQGAFFHSSVMYRKALWQELGGFDTTFACYEDYDFVVRLLGRARIHYLDGALGAKRRHPGQAFDQVHWTNTGYRMRARIGWRYLRGVRWDPAVAVRTVGFLFMTKPMLMAIRRAKGEHHDPATLAALGKPAPPDDPAET